MRHILYLLISAHIIILNSCSSSNSSDDPVVPDWYPSQLVIDEMHLSEYDVIASTFADTYNLDKNSFLTDSLAAHLDYVFNLDIKLCTFSESADRFETIKEEVPDFLNEWYRLVSLEPFEIDSINIETHSDIHYVRIYIKELYSHSLYKNLGSLGQVTIRINEVGDIIYLASSLLPQLRVPEKSIITQEEAINILDGYKYTLYSLGGFEEHEFSAENVSESKLEVYIEPKNEVHTITSQSYRLVWRISASFVDFFVDSQTGEIVGYFSTIIV